MAYTFDRINNLFNKDQQQNRNIIGDSNNTYQKTQTGGDVTSDSYGGTPSQTSGQTPQQMRSAPTSAAIKRNVTRTQVPGFASDIYGQLGTAQQNLQKESQDYLSGYQNKNYGIDSQNISNAVMGGDQNQYSQLAQRLAQQSYGPVDYFNPTTSTVNEKAALLGSEQGTKRLLGQTAGSTYTPGESSFDISLLRRNPEFTKIANQIGVKQGQLRQEEADLRNQLPGQAQLIADTGYNKATEDIRNSLSQLQSGIQDPLMTQAQNITQQRQGLRSVPQQDRNNLLQNTMFAGQQYDPSKAGQNQYLSQIAGFLNQNLGAGQQQAQQMLSGYDPRAAGLISNVGMTPSKYYSVGGDVGWQDLLDEPTSQQFNRIQNLLGTGNFLTPGAGAGQDLMFDTERYAADLSQGARSALQMGDKQRAELAAAAEKKAKEDAAKAEADKKAKAAAEEAARKAKAAAEAERLRARQPGNVLVGTQAAPTKAEIDALNNLQIDQDFWRSLPNLNQQMIGPGTLGTRY